MDEMKVSSKFTTGIISKILQKVIKDKIGSEVGIQINEITLSVENEMVSVHLSADTNLRQSEVKKLLTRYL